MFCLSFSEKLFMQTADRMAEDGFRKAGYEYVCIDVSAKPDPFAITVEPCLTATVIIIIIMSTLFWSKQRLSH